MSNLFDVVVLGAGMAGLSAGALCAKDGMSVMILEQHNRVGGCAGDFFKGGHRFPAGATMALGFGEGGLNRWLFETLGLNPPLLKVDPVIQIHLPDRHIHLHQSQEQWISELSTVFPERGIRTFWAETAQLGGICYRMASRFPPLPPKSVKDVTNLMTSLRPELIRLLPRITSTVGTMLQSHGANGREHRALIDNLLLISLQCTADECAAVPGVMGLDIYRHGAWAVEGGMATLASMLRKAITAAGGQLWTRRAVTRISPPSSLTEHWSIETDKGDVVRARSVIANLTGQTLSTLLGDHAPAGLVRRKLAAPSDWGAFMLYLAVRDEDLPAQTGAVYHQILKQYDADPSECNSAFISVGDPSSSTRPGIRIITASTHTNTAVWSRLAEDDYAATKSHYEEQLLARVEAVFPGATRDPVSCFSASPRTYAFYTGRPEGSVGGYPSSHDFTLLRSPSRRTGLPGLVMAGDTVYPGQGMGTVVSAHLAWQECRTRLLEAN